MKFLTAQFKGRDEEKREITAFASSPRLDRDREIIRADAWDLTSFKKHPVLVLSHDYQKLWVGKITEIKPTTDGLFFRAVFAKTAAAEEVWQLIKSTNMAAFSVGFLPIASESIPVKQLAPAEQKAALAAGITMNGSVRVYSKVELLEISVVSVPSNTSATLLSWKSLAKTPALRAALEEITFEDGPEKSIEKNIDAYLQSGDFKKTIDKAVAQAIAQANLPGQIEGAVKERAREFRNEEWRKYFLDQIMKGWRAAMATEEKAKVQGRTFAQFGGTDLKSPERMEAYAKAHIAAVDFEKLIDDGVRLAIDKARGKVY